MRILDWMLVFIRWLMVHRLVKGKDALGTILKIRQARERVINAKADC